MDVIDFIFALIVLIMSVIAHEVAHGLMANKLGDPTARLAGRLTLNPVSHFDPVGSLIVPAFSYFMGGFLFGWAKPVPFNPYNLRGKYGSALVAAAGPLTNLTIAVVFGLLIRFGIGILPPQAIKAAITIVGLNILLGVFNLVPVPPLDGSKVLFSALPYRLNYIQEFMETYGLIFLFMVAFFAWPYLSPIVGLLFGLITGLPIR